MGLGGMGGGAWVVGVGVVSVWVAWVKLLCGLRGLHGSKYFLCGSSFYMMGHNYFTWGCIGLPSQTFLCVSKNFYVCPKIFMWVFLRVKFFCVDPTVYARGNFWG